jgi:hypothetical protein
MVGRPNENHVGWDPPGEPVEETSDFDGDGEETTETRTLIDWLYSVLSGGEFYNNLDVWMDIAGRLEYAILDSKTMISLYSGTSCEMISRQIEYGTRNFNHWYAFGGTRNITFNYSDQEWAEYVAANGGQISYE